MNERSDLTDAQIDAVLAGGSDDEALEALRGLVSGMRSSPQLSSDVAVRHATAAAGAARLVAGLGAPEPAPDASPIDLLPDGEESRRSPVSDRKWLAKAAVAGFAVALLAGSAAAAGALPDPVQRTAADVASALGIDLPDPDTADGFTATDLPAPANVPDPSPAQSVPPSSTAFDADVAPQATLGMQFADAMHAWASCVGDAAARRGETQSDDATREDEPFDPVAECDDAPHPSEFGIGEQGGGAVPESVPVPDDVSVPEEAHVPSDLDVPEDVPPFELGSVVPGTLDVPDDAGAQRDDPPPPYAPVGPHAG